MDQSSHGDDDNDSAIVPRSTGQLSFKKLKRTRIRVDHLTDEEKRWRKRILGRERARRYRERKRASESSPEESSDACIQMEAPAPPPVPASSPKLRGRGRPKGSRTKKRRLILLTPQSKNFDRGGSAEQKFPAFGFARHASPSSASPQDAVNPASCSWAVCNTAAPSRPMIMGNPTSLTGGNVGTFARIQDETSFPQQAGVTVIEGTLQDNTIMLSGRVCETLPNEAEESLVEEPLSIGDPNQQPNSRQTQTGAANSHRDDSQFTDPTGEVVIAAKMRSADVRNPSQYCDQKGQLGPRLQRRKRRFKQQNVRDFINFFPIDDLGCTDSKSFVSGSCSLQRQVEYVPSGKRLYASRQSACEAPTKPPSGADVISPESESVESNDAAEDACLREMSAEKSTAAPSESGSTPSAASTSHATIGSAQLSDGASVAARESPSTQPSALAGPSLPQMQDVQIAGLLQQQQLINAAASVQALNTVGASSHAIAAAQKTSDSEGVPSLRVTMGLPKQEGLTGVQGLARVQSVDENSACQGFQGVTDPRLLPLAGISGIQNVASLQGVVGGLPGIAGLQGVTSLQGLGCMPGIAAPTSPAALVGLQGIPNLHAVQAFQGIQGFQPMANLQGLVTLQGIAGIQGLHGVGIAGLQSAPGLQAVTTLQGGTYLPYIAGIQGTSGLISGLPAVVSGQQETPAVTEVAITEGAANLKEAVGQEAKGQEVDGITTDLRGAQPCQPGAGIADGERSGSSRVPDPADAPPRSLDVAASTQEKMQRGRSRRKQASPRCITKQPCLEFTSRDGDCTGAERESCPCADPPSHDSGQSGNVSLSGKKPPESKKVEPITGSTTQRDGGLSRPQPRDPPASPRPGEKLSKKVEELMSATQPHRRLNVDCSSSSSSVDDESPSPQTWRRFLEREKQRHNRLKEVEEQLARLQAHAERCQAFSPKSFVSTATQTDSGSLPGHQKGRMDRALRRSPSGGQGAQTTNRVHEGGGVTGGQIQQGVVTSSGDSHFGSPSPEASRSEDEVVDTAQDGPVSPNEVPPDAGKDAEATIKNSPRTIWLHSSKRKKKASQRSAVPSASSLGDGSGAKAEDPLGHDAVEAGRSLRSSPSSSPQKKLAKFVFQIPPEDLATVENTARGVEAHELPSDNRVDSIFEMSAASGSVSMPGLSFADQNQTELPPQPQAVLPWEVQGLSKIERNRIRAREGMRRHREKLRQAKLAAQTLMSGSALPDSQPLSEVLPIIWEAGPIAAPDSVSLRTPGAYVGGKIEAVEGTKFACLPPAPVTTSPAVAKTEVIESTCQVPGSKKPFDILADVAVKIEPPEIQSQDSVELPSTQTTEELNASRKTIPSGVHTDVQISAEPKTESPVLLKISKARPIKLEAGSPSHVPRIDFTQEPYKSMSLRDRNRIRAREGMRRYRERMRLSQLTPPQPPKVLFGKSRPRGGSPKSSLGKLHHQGSTNKRDESVAASSQLVELAKRHTEESSGPAVTYTEFMEHGKAEVMKRKRAYSLLRQRSGRPKKKLLGRHLPLSQVSKAFRLQEEALSGPGVVATVKSGHFAFPPTEFIPDADAEGSPDGDPEGGSVNPSFTKPKKCSQLSEEHPESPVVISAELLEDAEEKKLTSESSEGMMDHPSDLALRNKVIQEKIMCGMDKYTAISSSAGAQGHPRDPALAASDLEDCDQEEEQRLDESDLLP